MQSERSQGWGRDGDEQANESDSFPDPVELSMSKHKRRDLAKVSSSSKEKKKSQLSNLRANTRASGAKTATTTAQMVRTGVPLSSWRQTSNSNRMRNICRNVTRSGGRPRTAQARRFLSPFFFCGCWCNFFPRPFLPLWLLVQILFNAPLCLWEHSRCLSSAWIVMGAVTGTPAENLSPLSRSPSPLLLRVSIKKKTSVSPHDSQIIQANVRQPFQVPLNSAFDRLKMNSGRPSARYHSR